MRVDIKDKNPNNGSVFFIILFLVFVFINSDRSEIKTYHSFGYFSHNEMALDKCSLHFDAAIFDAIHLRDLYKFGVNAFNETSFNKFSLQYNLSFFNNFQTRNFNDIQKATIEIEPLFLRRLLYHLSLNNKEVLPVLS
jgi:hypothetical protein